MDSRITKQRVGRYVISDINVPEKTKIGDSHNHDEILGLDDDSDNRIAGLDSENENTPNKSYISDLDSGEENSPRKSHVPGLDSSDDEEEPRHKYITGLDDSSEEELEKSVSPNARIPGLDDSDDESPHKKIPGLDDSDDEVHLNHSMDKSFSDLDSEEEDQNIFDSAEKPKSPLVNKIPKVPRLNFSVVKAITEISNNALEKVENILSASKKESAQKINSTKSQSTNSRRSLNFSSRPKSSIDLSVSAVQTNNINPPEESKVLQEPYHETNIDNTFTEDSMAYLARLKRKSLLFKSNNVSPNLSSRQPSQPKFADVTAFRISYDSQTPAQAEQLQELLDQSEMFSSRDTSFVSYNGAAKDQEELDNLLNQSEVFSSRSNIEENIIANTEQLSQEIKALMDISGIFGDYDVTEKAEPPVSGPIANRVEIKEATENKTENKDEDANDFDFEENQVSFHEEVTSSSEIVDPLKNTPSNTTIADVSNAPIVASPMVVTPQTTKDLDKSIIYEANPDYINVKTSVVNALTTKMQELHSNRGPLFYLSQSVIKTEKKIDALRKAISLISQEVEAKDSLPVNRLHQMNKVISSLGRDIPENKDLHRSRRSFFSSLSFTKSDTKKLIDDISIEKCQDQLIKILETEKAKIESQQTSIIWKRYYSLEKTAEKLSSITRALNEINDNKESDSFQTLDGINNFITKLLQDSAVTQYRSAGLFGYHLNKSTTQENLETLSARLCETMQKLKKNDDVINYLSPKR